MRYERIEDAGTLHLHYEGPTLDALSLGIMEVQLHRIAETVAISTLLQDRRSIFKLLERPSLLPPGTWKRLRRQRPLRIDPYLFYEVFPPTIDDVAKQWQGTPIIRMRSDSIQNGSLLQELSLYLMIPLADPDIRAVLQGFGGNLLYGIANCGLRGIQWVGEQVSRSNSQESGESQDAVFDPYDVGPNVRDIAKEMIANGNGEESSLTITHKYKDGEHQIKIQFK